MRSLQVYHQETIYKMLGELTDNGLAVNSLINDLTSALTSEIEPIAPGANNITQLNGYNINLLQGGDLLRLEV